MSSDAGPTDPEARSTAKDGGELLRVKLSKVFGTTQALADVEFALRSGEVHALVGQNGSGKSTVVKILSGYHRPDSGSEVFVGGVGMKFGSAGESDRLGMRFVQQDLGLIGTLDSVSNLMLGSSNQTRALGRIKWARERSLARSRLDEFGLSIDVDVPVSQLSRVEQTIVAVVKALRYSSVSPSLLILDEPTASLTRVEVEVLFKAIRTFTSAGGSVLYISHHLNEVMEMADGVTVLRDGRLVGTRSVASLEMRELVHMLLGRDLEVESLRDRGRSVRSVRPLVTAAHLQTSNVGPVSFELMPGEIVGLGGMVGCGAAELLESLFGLHPWLGGEVTVQGKKLNALVPRRAMQRGIAFVPSDRLRRSAVQIFTTRENLTLPLIPSTRLKRIDLKAEARATDEWLHRLDVRPHAPEAGVHSFSGGNQQKVILGRWLRREPRIMLLDQPTQGVDIGARVTIYEILRGAARDGCGIMLFSPEPEELALVSDRVLVMSSGCIIAELTGSHVTAHRILRESLKLPGSQFVGERA